MYIRKNRGTFYPEGEEYKKLYWKELMTLVFNLGHLILIFI